MSLAKKLKMIIKGEQKPSFGTDPNEPWSVRAGITESESGMLSDYLKSRGINPQFVSKDTKISHSKSGEFQKWKRDHMFDDPADTVSSVARDKMKAQREEVEMQESVDKEDTITFDIPLLIRMFEYAREDAKTDMDLHKVTEKLISIRDKGTLTMADYDFIVKLKESVEIMEKKDPCWTGYTQVGMKNKGGREVPNCVPSKGVPKAKGYKEVKEAKTIQGTALDRFRMAALEREKKHNAIEKERQERLHKEPVKGALPVPQATNHNMTAAIDRLEKHLNKEGVELEEAKHYPYRYRATYHDPDTNKMTHIMDFNHKSLDAAKKHAEGSRLQRKDGKEDKLHSVEQIKEEQIDEISKSTLDSYRDKAMASNKNAKKNREASEAGKDMSKGFADLHAKSNAIVKKRIKGLSGYLQRKHGMKPGYEDQRKTTTEDVYQDPQAATQTVFDGGTNPNDCECDAKKRAMSKSARMIKALYKKNKMVKEEIYDHEKEDKSVATYGKKPKVEKTEEFSDGDDQAAMVLKGGKTLTGQTRDTLEIDPVMRKSNKNNDNKTNK